MAKKIFNFTYVAHVIYSSGNDFDYQYTAFVQGTVKLGVTIVR